MTDPDVVSGERDAAPRDEAVAAPASDAPAGYGARLAWERQRAGMGVTDIAARLRLHPDQVRAIEQENLARLPEPPYVRGFIRGYARALNIDPVPLLSDLNAKLAPVPDSEPGDTGSGYTVERGAGRERSSRWVMGIAVTALIALGLVGWQTTQREVQTQPAPAVLPPVAPPTPARTPAAEAVSPPASAEVTTPPATAETPAPSKQTQAAPVAAAPVAASTVAAAPATTAPAAATSSRNESAPTLLLRFTGASWVEVTDAGGKVLLSQLSAPGAEHALEGDLPLNVLIGDATRTSVEVRGVAFNLLPIMRNNVARFTVK